MLFQNLLHFVLYKSDGVVYFLRKSHYKEDCKLGISFSCCYGKEEIMYNSFHLQTFLSFDPLNSVVSMYTTFFKKQ
jgi:hypothetical protein